MNGIRWAPAESSRRRGPVKRFEAALPLLQRGSRTAVGAAHRYGHGPNRLVNLTIQLWTGQLLLEMDGPREAIPYFRATRMVSGDNFLTPPALLGLGAACEAIGENARAAGAYRLFAEAWRDADPSLQPAVRRAREKVRAPGTWLGSKRSRTLGVYRLTRTR